MYQDKARYNRHSIIEDATVQTYEAFGCTATVKPMTGYDQVMHGCHGWYAAYFSFPAQPQLSYVHRGCKDMHQVMVLIQSEIGRNVRGSVRKITDQ